MNKIKQFIAAFALVLGIGFSAALPVSTVGAIDVFNGGTCTGSNASNPVCKASKTDNDAKAKSMAKMIINTMLMIVGILSVIMVVFGGIRYTISSGDASKVKAAKDTIMYAIIGVVVSILSYAIINFVLTQI